MSSTSYYDTESTPCLPGRNIKVTNAHVCQDLAVNTINGQPYPPGIPVPPLVANKVFRTNGTGTLAFWGDVPQGSSRQILHTNLLGTGAEWTTDLSVPGALSTDSSLTVAGSTNLQGDLQFNGVSGTLGQVLTKTGANTQAFQNLSVPPSSITPGLANQVFVTDPTGTSALFSNNINLPGNLTVNGNSTVLNMIVNGSTTLVNAVTVNSDLQFNGSSGAVGAVITKTALNDQDWVLPSQIANIRYVTAFALQNLNAAAGPTALSFNTSPITNIASASRGSITGISQPSATQFSVGFTGTYDIQITGFIDSTSTGTVSSVVALSIEVNGVELTNSCIVVNTLSFVGQFSGIPITAGNVVRLLARRVLGTGTFNTFAAPATAPSFASTISFGLVSTVN